MWKYQFRFAIYRCRRGANSHLPLGHEARVRQQCGHTSTLTGRKLQMDFLWRTACPSSILQIKNKNPTSTYSTTEKQKLRAGRKTSKCPESGVSLLESYICAHHCPVSAHIIIGTALWTTLVSGTDWPQRSIFNKCVQRDSTYRLVCSVLTRLSFVRLNGIDRNVCRQFVCLFDRVPTVQDKLN